MLEKYLIETAKAKVIETKDMLEKRFTKEPEIPIDVPATLFFTLGEIVGKLDRISKFISDIEKKEELKRHKGDKRGVKTRVKRGVKTWNKPTHEVSGHAMDMVRYHQKRLFKKYGEGDGVFRVRVRGDGPGSIENRPRIRVKKAK